MTTRPDEVKPRRRGGRRAIYPKRVELRMTQSSFDLAEESAKRATEATGRAVTVSDIIREAVDDGCKRLACEQATAPVKSGNELTFNELDALIEGIQDARTGIRKTGHNINQLTRLANASGQVPNDLVEIKQQLAQIDARLVLLAGTIAGVAQQED